MLQMIARNTECTVAIQHGFEDSEHAGGVVLLRLLVPRWRSTPEEVSAGTKRSHAQGDYSTGGESAVRNMQNQQGCRGAAGAPWYLWEFVWRLECGLAVFWLTSEQHV